LDYLVANLYMYIVSKKFTTIRKSRKSCLEVTSNPLNICTRASNVYVFSSDDNVCQCRKICRTICGSGSVIKLFQAPRKNSITFHFDKSFILDDVKLADLANNSFE